MPVAERKIPTGLPCMLAACLLLSALPGELSAQELQVAVASNFLGALKALSAEFEHRTGYRISTISGSTGKLYAQILNGAPFAVFLAADAKRPQLIENAGLAVPGSRFTYAVGRLVLWSPASTLEDDRCREVLDSPELRHLAIANQNTAPYGEAARQTLQALGRWDALEPRLVRGENIGQAFRFVLSGNAEAGFVALSQIVDFVHIIGSADAASGCRWTVPQEFHEPLAQQAVLLASARDDPAARAFVDFLRGPEARAIIQDYGYLLP